MKKKISFCKKHLVRFLKDESGQGTMEYILILVGVVGLGLAFRKQIVPLFEGQIEKISGGMGKITIE